VNLFLPTAEELLADDRKDLLQKVRFMFSFSHVYSGEAVADPFCEASCSIILWMHLFVACKDVDARMLIVVMHSVGWQILLYGGFENVALRLQLGFKS
jgi:hypothetical protein